MLVLFNLLGLHLLLKQIQKHSTKKASCAGSFYGGAQAVYVIAL